MPDVKDHTDSPSGYTQQQLAEIVGVKAADVSKWVARGLLHPSDGGECFDFQQLSRAQTLRDLMASGATLKKLRDAMTQFHATAASERPTVVCNEGKVFARLEHGELVSPAGQLQMEFGRGHEPVPMSEHQAKTAVEWYDCGVSHETEGDVVSAISCYREALVAGGPEKEIYFALAHALAASGQSQQAAERYWQLVELDPHNADAWNNLGVALSEVGQTEDACRSFRRVLELRPGDIGAIYNLADALEDCGNKTGARPHWVAYLRHDRSSDRAAYARRCLAAG